jgi:hypothetical protein
MTALASSSAAVGRKNAASRSKTFTFTVALAAPEAELQAWLDHAAPGESVTYASGFTLPRDAAGVKLVQAWQGAGLVYLTQKRDPADGRRWLFLAQRSSAGTGHAPRGAQAGQRNAEVTRIQMRKLLEVLRRVADRGEVLPSYRKLARELTGDATRKGVDRVSYLLRRLDEEGRIALIPAPKGAQHGPQVTVIAKGRGCGCTTARGGV